MLFSSAPVHLRSILLPAASGGIQDAFRTFSSTDGEEKAHGPRHGGILKCNSVPMDEPEINFVKQIKRPLMANRCV